MSVLNIDEMRAAALAIAEDRIEHEKDKMDMLLRGEHPEPRRWWYIFYDPRKPISVFLMNTRWELGTLQSHRFMLTLGDDSAVLEIASRYVCPIDFEQE